MTIITIDGMFTIMFDAQCDGCGERLGVMLAPLGRAVEAVKAAGWRLERTGLTWTHLCRECRRAPLAR